MRSTFGPTTPMVDLKNSCIQMYKRCIGNVSISFLFSKIVDLNRDENAGG